jgi:peptidoglycan hydrolase-like protein with peptidoglycan-binding domain
VDGIWGQQTEQALRNFQQSKHLPGNGQLDSQTLAALGVNINNQSQAQNASGNQKGQQGQSQTVGQSPNRASGQGNSSGGSGQTPQNKQ